MIKSAMTKFLLCWAFITAFILVLVLGPELLTQATQNKKLIQELGHIDPAGVYRVLIVATIGGAILAFIMILSEKLMEKTQRK
jgi:formate/nitrite transporter FocA (FNT family)